MVVDCWAALTAGRRRRVETRNRDLVEIEERYMEPMAMIAIIT
jgi:hypothetical protein